MVKRETHIISLVLLSLFFDKPLSFVFWCTSISWVCMYVCMYVCTYVPEVVCAPGVERFVQRETLEAYRTPRGGAHKETRFLPAVVLLALIHPFKCTKWRVVAAPSTDSSRGD